MQIIDNAVFTTENVHETSEANKNRSRFLEQLCHEQLLKNKQKNKTKNKKNRGGGGWGRKTTSVSIVKLETHTHHYHYYA